MNILTYNLCLKPVVFDLIKDNLSNENSIIYSIDFANTKKYYKKFIINNIFCDQRNSKKGLDHDKSKFEFYLNKKIISDLSKLELTVYRLMSRYEKDDKLFNFNSRKKHYFDLLKFAFGLIEKYKINKMIFFDYPHHMESLVLYEVAKYLKIDTTIISYLFLGEYRLVVDKKIDNRFEDFSLKNKINKFEKKNIEYFNKVKNKISHMKPFYLKENSNFYHLIYYFIKDIYRSFLNGLMQESNNFVKTKLGEKFQNLDFPSEISSSINMFLNRLKILNLKKIYKKCVTKKPDLSKNYILFCPNLQPEASTLPMAGIYSDFELILETLLKELPDDWFIYYKEHPLVFNLLKESFLNKNKYYYNHITNQKIKFIDYKEDTFKLIDNSNLVVTPTGSVGLEAMIRGKKVAFFGNTWWFKFKDPNYIENSSDIKKMIDANLTKKRISNDNFIDDYKRTFEQTVAWTGFQYDSYEKFVKDYNNNNVDKNNLEKMKNIIISKINNSNI